MNTEKVFAELLFQVNPDKLDLGNGAEAGTGAMRGLCGNPILQAVLCVYGVGFGAPPRELKKIIKCVKYYAY